MALLGSGPEAPAPDAAHASYARLAGVEGGLVDLSELAYAKFCRGFERQATDWILSRRGAWPADSTVVVANDISEGPDLAALKKAGYAVVSIWHVDVVDYFSKLYLGGVARPAAAAAFYEALRRAKLGRLVPDVLRLVFEKQRQTVENSDVMVLPSRAMASEILRCYAGLLPARSDLARRFVVRPWGAIGSAPPPDPRRVEALKAHYQIGAETTTILTLSRISPEKGIHRLIEALLTLERAGGLPRDTAVLICGEAAFMQGRSYLRRVRRVAGKLRRARCFFPGYLSAAEKPAFFALADLFASPSSHESYGLTIVEAMRAGLPVLATDHYGVRDILDDACGVRVGSRHLSEALAALLKEPQRLADMGKAAAASAAAMRFADAAEAVLDSALGLLKLPAGSSR